METKLQPQFAYRGDIELLRLMAAGDSVAFEAWDEFYRRHGGYLYTFCKRAFEGRVGRHRIEEIVQDALVKAFHKAGSIRSDAVDLEDQRRVVRAWLGTMCKRIVSDYFRGQPLVEFMDEEALEAREASEVWKSSSAEDLDPVQLSRLRIVEEGLLTLTERERAVIRATFTWSDLGLKSKLPREVLADLTKSFDITKDNVRKIRERGMAKLRAYVAAHTNSDE